MTTTSDDKVRIPPDELRGLFLFEHLDDDQLRLGVREQRRRRGSGGP